MKVYTIDFSKCKTYQQFFEEIIKGMEFPDWCGENFDAIWDMLTWEIVPPAVIRIKGVNGLPKELEEKKDMLIEVFNDTHKWYKNSGMNVEIKIID